MDKGNVDKHRLSMSGLKAVELEKWGRDAARARYGEIRDPNMKAPEQCYPQFKQDQSAGKTYGDVSNDWRRAAK